MMTAFALTLGTATFAQTENNANSQTPIEKAKETPKQEPATAQPTQTEPRKAQETQNAKPATPTTPAAPKPADPTAPAKTNED